MILTTVTIGLASATLLTALRAAWLWWKASEGERRMVEHIAGSTSHILQIESEAAEAALLNAQAALWSGATAVLSALTTILGVTRSFF